MEQKQVVNLKTIGLRIKYVLHEYNQQHRDDPNHMAIDAVDRANDRNNNQIDKQLIDYCCDVPATFVDSSDEEGERLKEPKIRIQPKRSCKHIFTHVVVPRKRLKKSNQ